MKYKSLIFILMVLSLSSCKSDKPDTDKNTESKELNSLSDNDMFLNSVQNAYNAKKFNSEKQVKFNAKIMVSDTIFYEGYITIQTNSPQIRLLSSKIDTILSAEDLDSNYYKTLFWVAESYALPFWSTPENFQKLSSHDSTTVSNHKSKLTNSEFKITTHPITNIIENVEYNTDISTAPFNQGRLYFDRYITVNRIPVAMKWLINVDEETKAEVEISRISYPK